MSPGLVCMVVNDPGTNTCPCCHGMQAQHVLNPAECSTQPMRALGQPSSWRVRKLKAPPARRAAEAQQAGEGGKAAGKAGGYLAAADIVAEESATSTVSTYDCPVCRKPHILDLDRLQVCHCAHGEMHML